MVEAILFAVGEAVGTDRLAAAVGLDPDTTVKLVRNMMDSYAQEERGIRIIELDGSFQLCTKPEMYDCLSRLIHIPKKHVLTETLLETLSIIAYRQPVTKGTIEAIRGVSSDHAVNRLLEYGLIEEAGRLDAPGRPILFRTTEEFLRSFGLSSLSQLPEFDRSKLEDFKSEAEEELQTKVDI